MLFREEMAKEMSELLARWVKKNGRSVTLISPDLDQIVDENQMIVIDLNGSVFTCRVDSLREKDSSSSDLSGGPPAG